MAVDKKSTAFLLSKKAYLISLKKSNMLLNYYFL